jgi:hypothetical protein
VAVDLLQGDHVGPAGLDGGGDGLDVEHAEAVGAVVGVVGHHPQELRIRRAEWSAMGEAPQPGEKPGTGHETSSRWVFRRSHGAFGTAT